MSVTIDPTFSKSLDSLQAFAGATAQALVSDSQVRWFKVNGSILDGFDHAKIASLFSRNGTAKAYADALSTNNESYRTAQIAKIQGDVLSSIERDLRMRFRSRVVRRCTRMLVGVPGESLPTRLSLEPGS